MRLTQEQTQVIKTAVARELEPDARIWLFGSRANDDSRGGDIDLYVETPHADLLRELCCKIAIEEAVDLHVDLVIAPVGDDRPISRIARSEGIRL